VSKFSKKVRNQIKARANHRCEICGKKTENGEVHHVVPRYLNGTSTLNNGSYLCKKCHFKLHKKLQKVLAKYIRDNSMLWKKHNWR